MVPKLICKGINNISYPIDFYFIEKEEQSFEILELSKIVRLEALPEYKIFFVFDNNFKKEKKNIYIGLMDKDFKENKLFVIYFYLLKNKEFGIEFIVKYYDEEMMFKEIKDKIIPNGIEFYLNIMGNNHENNNNIDQNNYMI